MDKEDLQIVLDNHAKWRNDRNTGKRADLRDADLRDAGLIVLTLPIWTVYVGKENIRIGCKNYTRKQWLGFSDSQISEMDRDALAWCGQYKDLIMLAANTMQKQGENS